MGVKTERFPRPQCTGALIHLRPVFDDLERLLVEGDYESPRHLHKNYEAILAERGSYQCELNDEELTLEPGQVLVVTPGDCHQEHMRDGRRHYALHFQLVNSETGAPIAPLFDASASASRQIC